MSQFGHIIKLNFLKLGRVNCLLEQGQNLNSQLSTAISVLILPLELPLILILPLEPQEQHESIHNFTGFL